MLQSTPVNLKKNTALYLLIPLLFIIIYFPVFYSDYAYLDEIHQLWYNRDNSNFTMFLTQGRWLTGLLFQKFFASIHTITQLKWLRVFSLVGWMATAVVWAALFKKWIGALNLNGQLWWMGVVYVACSISVTVYIGWASCMEVFIAVLAGLLSGHLLYSNLYRQGSQIQLSNSMLLGALLLGVVSLFIYQTAFGAFLLPFFFHYMQRKLPKPDKVIVIGVLFYLVVHVVYYLLFKQSLKAYHTEASTRTAIDIDILRKLSFFFSGPLPHGFSLNLLYSSKSIFSLVLYPLVIVIWVVSVFRQNRNTPVSSKLFFIAGLLLLLGLIYLPALIAAENFPSYRTLFAFNLAVFIMVMNGLLPWFATPKKQALFTGAICMLLLLTGVYTFQAQYAVPLRKEYGVLKKFVQTQYKPGLTHVHFIRADKYLFKRFGTTVYHDELGVPSTYRDWVPEPIIKQLVYEQTGNRNTAEKLTIIQYENEQAYQQSGNKINAQSLLIDMNRLFVP